MNRDELLSILADEFDVGSMAITGGVRSCVMTDTYEKQGLTVTFEDGAAFWITVTEVAPE